MCRTSASPSNGSTWATAWFTFHNTCQRVDGRHSAAAIQRMAFEARWCVQGRAADCLQVQNTPRLPPDLEERRGRGSTGATAGVATVAVATVALAPAPVRYQGRVWCLTNGGINSLIRFLLQVVTRATLQKASVPISPSTRLLLLSYLRPPCPPFFSATKCNTSQTKNNLR